LIFFHLFQLLFCCQTISLYLCRPLLKKALVLKKNQSNFSNFLDKKLNKNLVRIIKTLTFALRIKKAGKK